MAYVLIPDGFTLKKVTKLQEEAVKAHRRHEDLVALLGNENVPLVVGAGVLGAFLPALIAALLQAQEDALNITLTDKQRETLMTHPSLGPVGIANLLATKVVGGITDLEFPKDFKFGKGIA